MSSLTDRLRGVIRSDGPPVSASGGISPPPPEAVADVLGGEWVGEGRARFLVVDTTYAPGHRHGRLAVMDALPAEGGAWPCLDLLAHGSAPGRLLFLDLETTGLSGGAGTYAFLVGCGWFADGRFRVRQFFLTGFGAEPQLLAGVSRLASEAGTVVSFNGKSFDVPLIDTRFLLHRMPSPFEGRPHVDLLHPARRLWREPAGVGEGQGCRLTTLESMVFGVERDGDVPGFEIPARYFGYVRSGDARPLQAVLEHNRLDLLSLALLTAHVSQMLVDGPGGAKTAREALGLGRLCAREGLAEEARRYYARAAGIDDVDAATGGAAGVEDPPGLWAAGVDDPARLRNRAGSRTGPSAGGAGRLGDAAGAARRCTSGPLPGDALTRAEALRQYALSCRRARLHADAAVAWSRLLDVPGCPQHFVREATHALAVHHEHRLRDHQAARSFAVRALQLESSESRQQATVHRLARLDRKLRLKDLRPPGSPLLPP